MPIGSLYRELHLMAEEGLAIAAFRRGELHLKAELDWYTEIDQLLATLPDTPH